MKPMLMAILLYDLTLPWRRRGNLVGGVMFCVIAASPFPLVIGPNPQQLCVLAPGILWIAALLTSMPSLSWLFAQEHAGGSLDQLLLLPHPLALIVLTRIVVHWFASGLPLLLLTPIPAQQYSLPLHTTSLLTVMLLIGTSATALIGAIGAVLTLGVHNGATLLYILILPFCVPILVFGAGAGSAADAGLDVMPYLSLLGACLALPLFVCPLAMATGLRIAVK